MTEPMTPTTLAAEAAQALQGVTEGPWKFFQGENAKGEAVFGVSQKADICMMSNAHAWRGKETIRNARFIAFARAWVPEAAATCALSAENAALKAQVAEHDAQDAAWSERVKILTYGLKAADAQVAELTRERDAAQALAADAFVQLTQQQAARAAAEAKVARKDAAIREFIQTMESTGFSTRFCDGLRAALTEGTPE